MRSHAVSLAEPSWLRRTWERFSDYAIVVLGVVALLAVGFGVWGVQEGKNSSAAAAKYGKAAAASSAAAATSSATAATYAKRLTIFQHNAHTQNVASQDTIMAQNSTIIAQQSEIKYVLGVVVFMAGEVQQTITDHSGELAALSALEQQVLQLERSFAASLAQIPQITSALQTGQNAIISEYNAILTDLAGLKAELSGQAS